MLLNVMYCGNAVEHWRFAIISKSTACNKFEWLPAIVTPNPLAVAIRPAKLIFASLESGSAMVLMPGMKRIVGFDGMLMSPMSLLKVIGLKEKWGYKFWRPKTPLDHAAWTFRLTVPRRTWWWSIVSVRQWAAFWEFTKVMDHSSAGNWFSDISGRRVI